MKKLMQFCMMVVAACFMAISSFTFPAEAANIVLMPIVDTSDYEGVSEVFYDNAIDVIKSQNKYTLIDSEDIEKAINQHSEKGKLPTKDVLRNIAEATDADLVVCVEINQVSLKEDYFTTENKADVLIAGNTVSYDRTSDKFVQRKLHETETYDPAMYARQNYPLRKVARLIQHEMRRVMDLKGFKVERPRVSKF